MKMHATQYTIRVNDSELNEAIRQYAQKQGKSINETMLDSVIKQINYKKPTVWQKYAGKIKKSPTTDAEFARMRQVDTKDWL